MTRLSVRVSEDLARRFDATAVGQGGRSRLLRRVMERAAQATLPEPPARPSAPNSAKLTLRLSSMDLAALEAEAAATGLSRTQWSVALIRARLSRRPQLTRPDAVALIDVRRDLRRIGVNINQIARALNTAVMEGAVLDAETTQMAAFADEIRAHVLGLTEAFEGNLRYWTGA